MISISPNPVSTKIFSRQYYTPANPPAANPYYFNCPGNSRVRISNIRHSMSTLANTSRCQLIFRIPTYPMYRICGTSTAPAAITTTDVHYSTGIREHFYRAADNVLYIPLQPDLFLDPGEIIIITTEDMGAVITIADVCISVDQWIIS